MAFAEKKRLLELSPDKIVPNPAQPRLDFPQDELLQLAESIRQNGVLQPILVRRDRDRYVLVAGERRWRASRMAGLKTIPAIVQELSPQDGAVLALIENMQRSDLNFFEEAAAIYALMQDRAMTQEETARRLGMSQPSLANKIRLLRLSGEEQRMVLENHLTERHARALLRMEDPEKRMAALKTVIERKMNVAQTDTYIKSLLEQEGQAKRPKRTFIAKDVRLFLNTIDHAVQTMKEAGIGAAFQRKETDEYYECVVRIPKSAALCCERLGPINTSKPLIDGARKSFTFCVVTVYDSLNWSPTTTASGAEAVKDTLSASI